MVENEPMRVVQPKRERVCARRRLMRKPGAKKENVAGTSRRGEEEVAEYEQSCNESALESDMPATN